VALREASGPEMQANAYLPAKRPPPRAVPGSHCVLHRRVQQMHQVSCQGVMEMVGDRWLAHTSSTTTCEMLALKAEVAKGRAWHRRGSVRRNFRQPSIAKVRARGSIDPSRARLTRGAAARGQRATAVPSDPARGCSDGLRHFRAFSYLRVKPYEARGAPKKPSALFRSQGGRGFSEGPKASLSRV
jgi:hypothetical protein